MKSNKIQPQFIKKYNPRIGLIALATDFVIEKDFIKIIKDKDIDFFVNRIESYNPLSKENLIKIEKRLTGWQLESFKESYSYKIKNGMSLFKKNLTKD